MNYTQYLAYIQDIKDYDSPEVYAAEYGFPFDCPVSGESILPMFKIIFAASHNDWSELLSVLGLTAYKVGRKYGIPDRTICDWVNGKRTPPEYIIQLVGYAIISELPKNEGYNEE